MNLTQYQELELDQVRAEFDPYLTDETLQRAMRAAFELGFQMGTRRADEE